MKPLFLIGAFMFFSTLFGNIKDTIEVLEKSEKVFQFVNKDEPEFKKAKQLLKEMEKSSQSLNYQRGLLEVRIGHFEIALKQGKLREAKAMMMEITQEAEALHNHNLLIKCYKNMAYVNYLSGTLPESVMYHLRLVDLYKKINDREQQMQELRMIGVALMNMDQLNEAKKYYQKAYQLSKELNNSDFQNTANYYNLALTEVQLGNKEKGKLMLDSLQHMVNTAKIQKHEEVDWLYFKPYVEIGFAQYFKLTNDYEKMLEHALKVKELSGENPDANLRVMTNRIIGTAYRNIGELDKAEFHLKKVAEFADKFHLKFELNEGYMELSQLYADKKDYKKAYEYELKHNALKDSIFDNNQIKFLKSYNEFQSEKKDQQIAQQQLIIENKNKKTIIIIVGAAFILLALSAYIVYINQKNKLLEKERKSEEEQERYHNISIFVENQERERAKIAEQIHEEIGGNLSALKYNLYSNEISTAPMMGLVDQTISKTRELSYNLTSPSIKQFNLAQAIEEFCKNESRKSNLKIYCANYCQKMPELDFNQKTALYRIVQELVTNSIHHSQSPEITVCINCNDEKLTINVEDQGVGFDLNKEKHNVGLHNVLTRIELLKADYDHISDHHGTSFTISMDIAPSAQAN